MQESEFLKYFGNTNDYENLPSIMFGDDTNEYLINIF